MPQFTNTKTGRVVNVPDKAPTRKGRARRDKQWGDKITRMDRSSRWVRGKHASVAKAREAAAKTEAEKPAANTSDE